MTREQQEISQKWVAELRSGNYKQGKSYLHRKPLSGKDRYCCLGVLCELAVKAKIIQLPNIKPSSVVYMYGKDEKQSFLPKEVKEWAGLHYEDINKLVALNDSGSTFPTIATVIEKLYLAESQDITQERGA